MCAFVIRALPAETERRVRICRDVGCSEDRGYDNELHNDARMMKHCRRQKISKIINGGIIIVNICFQYVMHEIVHHLILNDANEFKCIL